MSVANELSAPLHEMDKAWAAFDVKAIGQLYAENCTLLGPGKTVNGRAAVEDYFRNMGGLSDSNLKINNQEIDGSGNLAFVRGTYSMKKDGKIVDAGFLTVWKKIDGKWLIYVDSST